jgi:uroporphyrinogen decarboxylase
MRHEAADRVPLDIGGTSLTGMRPGCQERLRDLLGFTGQPASTWRGIDERLLEWAGADFRSVGAIASLPSPHTRTISPTARVDCWGIRRELVGGDWQITHHPLARATMDDLAAFPWPEPRVDEALLASWQAQAQRLRADGRYVVVGEHPVFGILELGCWMCGYDDFLMRMASDPDFVLRFFDRVFAIQMAVIEQYYAILGPCLDLTTSGDDFGGQNGPLISPRMFARFIAPYFTARIARTKQIAPCYFWHHSCGSVFDLLDQILACGVDILNPVQTSAARMAPEQLKAAFGERVVFWGGVDVQRFLPAAAPGEVGDRVRELARVLGQNGGYVMAPAHEMQDDIPPENIVAWVEAMRDGPSPQPSPLRSEGAEGTVLDHDYSPSCSEAASIDFLSLAGRGAG